MPSPTIQPLMWGLVSLTLDLEWYLHSFGCGAAAAAAAVPSEYTVRGSGPRFILRSSAPGHSLAGAP